MFFQLSFVFLKGTFTPLGTAHTVCERSPSFLGSVWLAVRMLHPHLLWTVSTQRGGRGGGASSVRARGRWTCGVQAPARVQLPALPLLCPWDPRGLILQGE